jgi:hypothetical protein
VSCRQNEKKASLGQQMQKLIRDGLGVFLGLRVQYLHHEQLQECERQLKKGCGTEDI